MEKKLDFEKLAIESLAKPNCDGAGSFKRYSLRKAKLRKEILKCIEEEEQFTQSDIANYLGYSKRTIIRYMKEMQEDGLIVREGSNKTGRWKLKRIK